MVDLNPMVIKILSDNKRANADEKYKSAYIDGVLDLYNELRRAEALMLAKRQQQQINEVVIPGDKQQ